MIRKIMITGAGGFLGSRLAAFYRERFEIIEARHQELDITNPDAVTKFVDRHRPDLVLHCAAISNTGTCEKEPKLSEAVNLRGTVHVAQACRAAGSRMIFMSSDQIYAGSGDLRPNREETEIPLVNVYGRHKKQAEEEIMAILPGTVCLRLPWMYDFPVRGLKINQNLLCNLIRALIQNQPMHAAVHDYRGITYVQEVVRNMEAAMTLPGGIYNFGSPGTTSTYDAAQALLSLTAGNRDGLVVPDTERFKEHPRNLTMDMGKVQEYGILFPDTIGGFERCLKDNPEYVRAFFL